MNWTGSKRNKTKIKLEQQRQKEFFNRQRLKKVHKFLKTEPKHTRTLPSIDVVRQNDGNHQINSFLEESNHSNNEDDQISSPISLALNHSEDRIEIFCDDESNKLHESDSETKLDHEKANNPTTVSQSMTDILKRKQDLLQGLDWIGISVSSPINITNNTTISDSLEETNRRSQSHSLSGRYSKESLTSTHHFRRLNSPSISTKLSKESMYETTTVVDIATIIDSLSPLEQTNASEASIGEESLEWHRFLSTNDECNSKVSKIAESPPPPSCTDTRITLEANKSLISTSRTIETSALHSVVPQSITSTNIAWNDFLCTSNIDFEISQDDDEKFDTNSSLGAIDSPKLSSRKIIASKRCKKSNFAEFSASFNNNYDNSDSDYIKEDKQFNYNQDVIIGQNVLTRIHNLEVKNACLQLELSFLKQDMKCLMKATKNSSNEPPNEPRSSNIQTQTDEFEQVPATNIEPSMKQDFIELDQNPSQTSQPLINEQKLFVNESSQDGTSKDSINIPTSRDLTHSSSDHVKLCTKNTKFSQSSVSLMSAESPTTNFSNWETLPEIVNSDMYLFDALDDDDDPQKCLKD
ncbi:613_t:CDS:2 [Cetraspora pellucida]|uniref:613_t:CDS:1 n=1 Tax=Cetraspora pellucida TaxID=1433469 RepID=A0A9N9FT36_9GLOM|nr:613_t:CDS:2 [Cetraspora pellucida]